MAFIFAKARLKAYGQNVRRPRVVCTSESQYERVGPTRNHAEDRTREGSRAKVATALKAKGPDPLTPMSANLLNIGCRVPDHVLPRVVSYFDDIFGHSYNEYCGERLAISEFNSIQDKRKLCPIHGLRYFLPRVAFTELWPDGKYFAHFFEHPLYNNLDSFNKAVLAEIDGTVLRRHPDSDWKSRFKA